MPTLTLEQLGNGESAGSIRSKINSNFESILTIISEMGFVWCGTYSAVTEYNKGSVVYFNSALYISKISTIGLDPLNTSAWDFLLDGPQGIPGVVTADSLGVAIGAADDATPNDTDFIATSLTAGGILKKITWTNAKAFLKTYFDTLYAKYLGDADFYKYSIVRSVGNLIVNNSFETDLSGYATYGLLTISRVTSEFYNGVASMQIVASNNVSGVYVGYSFIVGKRYTMSFYAKGISGKQILSYTDVGGTLTSTLNGGWQRFEYTFIASSSGLVGINFRSQEALGGTFYIDAVQLEEGTLTAGPFTTTQGNLTVALKNYEGNDPTPSKPVKIQIGGVIRTITSALSCPVYSGANELNLGSAELATKEADIFVHLYWYDTATPARVGLCISRIPTITDMSVSFTSEKGVYIDYDGSNLPSATTPVVNIGRYNATLSAGAGYTWSIPATSVIINRPIYETRLLDWIPTVSGSGSMTVTGTIATQKYRLCGNIVFFKIENLSLTTGGTASTDIKFTLPFSNILYSSNVCVVNDSGYKGSMCNIQVGNIVGVSSSMTLGNWGLGANREIFLSAQSTI